LQYERARFGGLPATEAEFKALMTYFADLLSGMTELKPEIIEQIRAQAGQDEELSLDTGDITPEILRGDQQPLSIQEPQTPVSSLISPVTARTAPSRSITPYIQHAPSEESLGSVLRQPTEQDDLIEHTRSRASSQDAASMNSVPTETGSVVRHSDSPG
jgi:hypothetical protein